MFRPLVLVSLSACICTLGIKPLQAQNGTRGMNRGLGNAAANMGGRPQFSRSHNHTPGQAADLGRKVNGIQRANGALERVTPQKVVDKSRDPLSNQNRIYENRLDQADHLRDVSARNGNDELLETADRMEANAARNYERQTGTPPPQPTETVVEGESVQTAPPTLPGREVTARAKRGFWFRAR